MVKGTLESVNWSDYVYVYPTDGILTKVGSTPGRITNPFIAGVEVNSFWPNSRFEYVFCEPLFFTSPAPLAAIL